MEGPASSDPSPSSPVTWHVAFWVLLALALNSMAQPAGRICGHPSRFRIYLASSPIICATDALLMLTRLAFTVVYIDISLPKAARLLLLWRADRRPTKLLSASLGEPNAPEPEASEPKLKTWPRWLFFAMGVLPAAIKLASFSGVPWTQAWGLMFAASFAVIEIVTLLAQVGIHKHDTPVPAALGLSSIEWQEPRHQQLRSKVARLSTIIGDLETTIFLFAIFAQLGIAFWTVGNLCISAKESNDLPVDIYNLFSWVRTVAVSLFCLLFLTCVALKVVGYFLRQYLPSPLIKWSFFRMLKWLIIGVAILGLVPVRDRSNKTKFNRYTNRAIVWNGMCMFTWLCYAGMHWICERFPAVAKALLIETKPS